MDYTYEVTVDEDENPLALLQTNEDTFNYRENGEWVEVPDDDSEESDFYDRVVEFVDPDKAEELVNLWDENDGNLSGDQIKEYVDKEMYQNISKSVE